MYTTYPISLFQPQTQYWCFLRGHSRLSLPLHSDAAPVLAFHSTYLRFNYILNGTGASLFLMRLSALFRHIHHARSCREPRGRLQILVEPAWLQVQPRVSLLGAAEVIYVFHYLHNSLLMEVATSPLRMVLSPYNEAPQVEWCSRPTQKSWFPPQYSEHARTPKNLRVFTVILPVGRHWSSGVFTAAAGRNTLVSDASSTSCLSDQPSSFPRSPFSLLEPCTSLAQHPNSWSILRLYLVSFYLVKLHDACAFVLSLQYSSFFFLPVNLFCLLLCFVLVWLGNAHLHHSSPSIVICSAGRPYCRS